MAEVADLRDVQETILILVLIVDRTHQSGGGRQDFIHEDENGLLGGQLDSLADNIDELADRQVCRDEVLLLVDGGYVGLFNFLADDLYFLLVAYHFHGCQCTYRDAISVLLSDAVGFGLALLEFVFVLELGAHYD